MYDIFETILSLDRVPSELEEPKLVKGLYLVQKATLLADIQPVCHLLQ